MSHVIKYIPAAMKNNCNILVCILFVTVLLFPSCKKTDNETQKIYKIGLVGGLGGFSDRGFNQNILSGFQQAVWELPVTGEVYECQSVADMTTGINYFLSKSFDMIITSGFDAADATLAAAKANPGTDFLLIDYSATDPPSNLLCAVFDVDQGSFPCGFLAAFWAYKQNISNPVAGFVAGPEIPGIRQFSVSYIQGIGYFNAKYGKTVQSRGYYASSFSDTLQGAELADSLMRQNATVIFAFAGKTGNGALYKAKEAGRWAIGVDVDQYISIPQVGPALLTSCMKGLDVMVYDIIDRYCNNNFPGGTIAHGTLENGGVGLAPFHDFDSSIPDSIKTALTAISTGIKNGTIDTGWPE
jgi:basic membrane protein A